MEDNVGLSVNSLSGMPEFDPNPRVDGNSLPSPIIGAAFEKQRENFFRNVGAGNVNHLTDPKIRGGILCAGLNSELQTTFATAIIRGNQVTADEHYKGFGLHRMGFVREVWLRGMGDQVIGTVWYRFTQDECSSGVFMMLRARMMSLAPPVDGEDCLAFEKRMKERVANGGPGKPVYYRYGEGAASLKFGLLFGHGGPGGGWSLDDSGVDAPTIFGMDAIGAQELDALHSKFPKETDQICTSRDKKALLDLFRRAFPGGFKGAGGGGLFLPMA